MRSARVLAATILLAAGLAGCSSSPAGPSGPLTGTWQGTVTDAAAGAGTAALLMTQTGSGVSGSWTMAFANAALNQGGTLGATVMGSPVAIFLSPNAALVCSSTVTLTGTIGLTATVNGSRLTGSYSVLTCSGSNSGTVDLTRQ